MKISFIGAGKVGTTLGCYFNQEEICYYYSKSIESAQKASIKVGCQFTDDLSTLIDASELIFVTVNDDALLTIGDDILDCHLDLSQKTFIHTSGASISDVLQLPNTTVASMHPLQTFSDIDIAINDLKTAYFAIEGSNLDILKLLIEKYNNPYFELSKDQKNKYHLSAVIFSNYLVSLMHFGNKMMESIGIGNGVEVMKPLINATLKNIYLKGPEQALTGPIKRGDVMTLKNHMSELSGLDLEVYQILGKLTTDLISDSEVEETLRKLWGTYE